MKNSRNEVLEDTSAAAPTVYLHGSNGIQPHLQQQLEGLTEGDRKIVYLSKSSGLTEDDFTFEVTIASVRNALPEELLLGYPVPLAIEACGAECECYKKNQLSG